MPVPSIGDSCFVLRPQLQRTMDIKGARKREKSGHTRNCLSLMPAPLDRRALFCFKTLTRQNSGVSRTLASGRKHTRAKPFRFLSRHSTISFWRKAGSYFPRPRLRSQTTMSMTVPQTQGCSTSSCGPGRVSRRFQMGGFRCQSVSVSKQCHARGSRIQCQSVPGETIRNCAKIGVSDHRAGLCHQDRLGAR